MDSLLWPNMTMLCTPYHRWPALYPKWAHYLQWLVRLRALKIDRIFLLSEAPSLYTQPEPIEQLTPLIKREMAFEFDFAIHFLMFQTPKQTPHSFFDLPLPVDLDVMENWAASQEGHCQAQFFLGHNPIRECCDGLEHAGNRWWPTHAWCRGWTWRFGEEV